MRKLKHTNLKSKVTVLSDIATMRIVK